MIITQEQINIILSVENSRVQKELLNYDLQFFGSWKSAYEYYNTYPTPGTINHYFVDAVLTQGDPAIIYSTIQFADAFINLPPFNSDECQITLINQISTGLLWPPEVHFTCFFWFAMASFTPTVIQAGSITIMRLTYKT